MCVCVFVCVSVSVCVLECIRQCVCVSWNGVEEPGRGTGLRVRERIRNYSSSLLVVTRRRYSSSLHKLHENSNQNYARTILRVTMIAWT